MPVHTVSIITETKVEEKKQDFDQMLFRFLHDFPDCFWMFHTGSQWEQATAVVGCPREKYYVSQLNMNHVKFPDEFTAKGLVGLGRPGPIDCTSKLAEGGRKVLVFNYFLLAGGKKER